jgi:hypothetical protein
MYAIIVVSSIVILVKHTIAYPFNASPTDNRPFFEQYDLPVHDTLQKTEKKSENSIITPSHESSHTS